MGLKEALPWLQGKFRQGEGISLKCGKLI